MKNLEVSVGRLYLPCGKKIDFCTDCLFKNHIRVSNPREDELIFVSYPEVESKLRYLKVKPGDIFLDIGACVGSWSIYAAMYGAISHAFDAGRTQLYIMAINMAINGIDNITMYNIALSSNSDGVIFNGQMNCGLKPSDFKDNDVFKIIRSVPLDEWVRQYKSDLSHIDYIKIDVEGMEYEVLKGAINSLKEYRPKVIIEIHDRDNSGLRYNIENFFKDLGYNHEHIPGLNDYFYTNTDP